MTEFNYSSKTPHSFAGEAILLNLGCPKGIASDSASRVIDEAYKEASRVLEEDGGEITHPVLSETDIIPDNPPSFFHRLMDRAEKYRDERLSLDESGFRYF